MTARTLRPDGQRDLLPKARGDRRRGLAAGALGASARRSRLTRGAASGEADHACTETKHVAAAPGEQHVLNQPAPILTVNHPRMDSADNWKRRKVLAGLGKLQPASAVPTECATRGLKPPYNQGDSRVTSGFGANGNYKMLLVSQSQNTCAPFNASVMAFIGASGS